jgi:hypothetical protein
MYKINPGEFYYHFKRDTSKGIEDHAYYIYGLAQDTEDRSQINVIYKPLYFCDPLKPDEAGISFHSRPYTMFIESVDRPGYQGPRFVKIEDEKVIGYLRGLPLFESKFMDE